MIDAALVGVGGAAGATARFLVGERAATPGRATLAVNVLGSLLLGALTTLAVGEHAALLAGTGFCGAFTTFSSFAVETVDATDAQGPLAGARIAAIHLGGALAAVGVGSVAGLLIG